MLAAYFDASGHHATGKFLVVGGFVAHVHKWATFELEWSKFISSEPYKLEYVHGKEISKWPEGKRRIFYLQANYLLKETVLFGVAATVKHADYKNAFRNYPLSVKDSHYGMTFRSAMVAVCKTATELSPEEPIAFILEEGDPNQGGAKHIFDLTKAESEAYEELEKTYPVKSITISKKKEFGALQAADLHAHTKWKHHQRQAKTFSNYQGDINHLLTGIRYCHFDVDIETIREHRKLLIEKDMKRKEYGRKKFKRIS